MTKSQFNIKISQDLLVRVKRQAMMSGKSLTEHITDLVTKSLSENDNFHDADKNKCFEERLLALESVVSNREYLSGKLKPFTDSEAFNCTEFMRGVFDHEVDNKNFNDKYHAFDDYLNHLSSYAQLNQFFTERLKEIMINDNSNPWTANELNELVGDDKCNCPIRKGLISWTGKIDCPSQQEICDKGKKLLDLL